MQGQCRTTMWNPRVHLPSVPWKIALPAMKIGLYGPPYPSSSPQGVTVCIRDARSSRTAARGTCCQTLAAVCARDAGRLFACWLRSAGSLLCSGTHQRIAATGQWLAGGSKAALPAGTTTSAGPSDAGHGFEPVSQFNLLHLRDVSGWLSTSATGVARACFGNCVCSWRRIAGDQSPRCPTLVRRFRGRGFGEPRRDAAA